MTQERIPNFLVIGPSKAATTSLFHYLCQHREVYLSPIKNPKFFYDDYREVDCPGGGYTLDDYESGIPYNGRKVTDLREYLRLFDAWSGQQAAGEISPGYLTYAKSARLISEFNRDIRLIAILRDPVKRAYSNYTHLVSKSMEDRPFIRALEEEPVEEPVGVLTESTKYIREGLYYRNLTRFLQYFGREQILTCWFDELASQPRQTLLRIFRFLGLKDDEPITTNIAHNVTRYSRSGRLSKVLRQSGRSIARSVPRPLKRHLVWIRSRLLDFNSYKPEPMSRAERSRAIDFFREDTQRLQELLKVDLSGWMQ